MGDGKIDGLMLLEAKQGAAGIETSMPAGEIAAAVLAGVIVIVKRAFDPHEMRRLRNMIIASDIPHSEPHFRTENSWRNRREEEAGTEADFLYEASFFAVKNPDDEIGQAVSATAERIVSFWRSLTGYQHTFVAQPDRRALRTWGMYYPAGGGRFAWHEHRLEPTKIGVILAMSERGVDFATGETEFRTPFGEVSTGPHHDLGDLCLFRHDLTHRVTPVDPDRERRWDGSGRWTIIIPVDPRPLEPAAA